ncbi:DUF6059 family protein [Streptomyces aureus]|uniref:DUF6059 family protein n=1 Tax=Streptomyces aureus TaxID=193461 RepID=UPI0005643505|nr:DUF6059 family protein [Streptomyces aureus]
MSDMRRAGRWTGLLARLGPGLLAVGSMLAGCPLPVPAVPREEPERTADPSGSLPAGHPERPAGHIPPTEVERELWSALGTEVRRTYT